MNATNKRENVKDAYVREHHLACTLVEQIQEAIEDRAAPEGATIDWTNVGTLREINRRLRSALAFANGTEC